MPSNGATANVVHNDLDLHLQDHDEVMCQTFAQMARPLKLGEPDVSLSVVIVVHAFRLASRRSNHAIKTSRQEFYAAKVADADGDARCRLNVIRELISADEQPAVRYRGLRSGPSDAACCRRRMQFLYFITKV